MGSYTQHLLVAAMIVCIMRRGSKFTYKGHDMRSKVTKGSWIQDPTTRYLESGSNVFWGQRKN